MSKALPGTIAMINRLILFLLLASCFACRVCRADQFFLTSGGRIEGELLNPEESPRQAYVVHTGAGKLTLKSGQVDRVILKSDAEKNYEKFVASLPDTAVAHWDTALRCEKANLKKQREYHLEQVIRLDPNHEKARHALGYSRVEGQWARADDVMKQKGYVRYGNAWRLPQEIELDIAADAQEKQTAEWRKNLKRWREWVVRNRERAIDGRTQILQIRDPLATEALIECLTRDKEPQLVRLLYVEPLAEIGSAEALITLVNLVLRDRDAKVRETCLEKIVRSGSKAAVREFSRALKDDDNIVVNRAGSALGQMSDRDATSALIEALNTEHKITIGGSGITPTFTGDGGGGLSMGGGPKVVKQTMSNEPVRRALVIMYPGVNFAFDEARWRAWYIEQNAPKMNVDLRRGK
jgi:hypothetical protein